MTSLDCRKRVAFTRPGFVPSCLCAILKDRRLDLSKRAVLPDLYLPWLVTEQENSALARHCLPSILPGPTLHEVGMWVKQAAENSVV